MIPPAWWQAKDHPVWQTIHMGAVVLAALGLSYANASHFDGGEVLAALGSAGVARAILGPRK